MGCEREREGIQDQAKRMCKERTIIYTRPVALVWLKPKMLTKLQGISKNLTLVTYSSTWFISSNVFLLLSDIFLQFLLLAGGDWAENKFETRLWRRCSGKSQGVWGPVMQPYCRGPDPGVTIGWMSSWIAEVHVSTCHDYSTDVNGVLDLPVCSYLYFNRKPWGGCPKHLLELHN